MIVPTKKLLIQAQKGRYAIPAFNINNLELLQGIVAGALKMRSPAIIQTTPGAIAYAGMENLASLFHNLASMIPIPLALHLDHGKEIKMVQNAIQSGFYQSIMYDGSHLPYHENVANTCKIVKLAHKKGISVEAELGAIPGKEDLVNVSHRAACFTDPHQAKDFVAKTGCNALAISIGTAHGAYKFQEKSHLDFPRLTAIAKLVSVPLVLHGASSVPDSLKTRFEKYTNTLHDSERLADTKGVAPEHIRRAIRGGIAKINMDTDLRMAFIIGVREALIMDTQTIDPREILGQGRELVTETVAAKITLVGSKNKAQICR